MVEIIAIVGPTATGKTALSLEVAELLGGPDQVEIISADAMQLYRGMDIGTAKVPVGQRRGIAHHQIDVLDVTENASVAAYQKAARADLEGIRERGKIPLVVGGSGLYVSGLLDELDFPGTDPAIREELEEIHARDGLEPLVQELVDKDPTSAARIDLRNPRRVIRALEVVRLTGRSFTPVFPRHTSHYDGVRMFGLRREDALLDQSINERAEHMFAGGLIEETRGLLARGLREGQTARRATGYAQAIAVIDGEMSQAEAIESVGLATRQLARRQRKWFRRDKRITWLDVADARDIPRLAAQIAAAVCF
ncbi:tRNA (adenosine(37)-N6)-dimethylallyltransferase MiaA [Trueperella bialowiezensis]|uniref:tRNA dimethylallyltransferase n=1 Tax=Trueperella bialowiezensis TaxID=312285 RepID=A0A3S4WFC3_9ACTO|nr:tRNA (adenosine(37)-N6)-dimethylallyltransferase MiaA [Trueperella bialowiezensis]VEI12624.1 tRNA dimethylallyltransferase [Trueperella bialowiezensis]